MPPVIIADTSCLILFDKIGELSLLQKLYSSITITQVIADEFGQPLPEWVAISNAAGQSAQFVLQASLDRGEASAIALALECTNCLLIIDEKKAF